MLKEYPVQIEINIAWTEMDAFLHVNNARYFTYFESARIVYFEKLKLLSLMQTSGIGPILKSTQCRFRIPLTYPDRLTVGARISKVEPDQFLMEYIVFSHNHQKPAATGEGLIVGFDYTQGKKAAFPPSVLKDIEKIESNL